MTFGGPFGGWGFTNPGALWLGLLALVIIAIHILKPRRTRKVVASILHWKAVDAPVTSARPWQRLKPSWLLFFQVLAALLLALVLAGPVRLTDEPLADHTIVIIDASASMQTIEDPATESSRLDEAKDRARELWERVPDGGEVTLIKADAEARALLTRSRDKGRFEETLDDLTAGDGTADFADAFTLAAGLNSGRGSTSIVFISDGGVPADQLLLAPAGTRFEPVGSAASNRGISQLTVEPTSEGLVARLTARNFDGEAATDTLVIRVDGEVIDRQKITLEPDEVLNLSIRVPAGDEIEAELDPDPAVIDSYRLDNRFFATVSRRPEITVLKVGEDNAFLETALEVIPGLTLQAESDFAATSASPNDDARYADVDVIIADRVAIPEDLDLPVWAIAPPEGFAGIEPTIDVDRPPLTLVRGDSPLVAGLDLSEVLFARAQQVTVPTEAEVVLGAENAPLLTVVRRPGRGQVVYQSFAVDESNLPLLLAFPVITERILTDLAQASTPPPKLPVGAQLPIDARLEASVTDPFGNVFNLEPASAAPRAPTVGFWSVSQPDRVTAIVAVNPRVEESSIEPVDDLVLSRAAEDGEQARFQGQIPLRRYVLVTLLLIVGIEWFLARRRVGVGRRQWRLAQGLRGAIAVSLALALFGLALNRPSDRLATLFLIDGSDSITNNVSAEIVDYVEDALVAKGSGDGAGVVAFGRNARLENVVGDDPQFDGISVDIDSSGTDLAAALRLGGAAVPGDARSRLVVLSDGRSTVGDVEAEAERLAAAGIPVDVVILESSQGADVAVVGVQAPSLAQKGERVSIEAEVLAPRAMTSVITLRRGSAIVAERTVELAPGSNTVVFEDTVSAGGVLRYQVEVDGGGGEPTTINNSGFAAVRVAGEQRVLIVDGSIDADGQTDNLVAVLAAAGLPVDLVSPDKIPVFEQLTQYSSVVLVNVSRGILADGQVENLTRLVRDLGRGLVVIGGQRSYGPGGYLNTDLERLLPVVSEITDPLRRQSVAEVLAVDISGSMAFDGRVDKLGLARAGFVRAIDNLTPTDEIGVITMDGTDRWALDLQADPSQEVIDDALARMQPGGGTFLGTGLLTAADALGESDAALKHIIMFSDGFTDPGELSRLEVQAAELYAEGITVSIMATGDGTPIQMERVAVAGGGRYYPGTNIQEVPDIIVQEVVQASRSYINEGSFLPTVTSNAVPVRGLTESPPILGYVATTPKATARVDLRVGPDADPLMASWRVGSGRVTAWTSDAGQRWTAPWNGWDQAPEFWAGVIKETFPRAGGEGGVETTIDGDQMFIRVEGADAWPDDAVATARVSQPDGEGREVTLERIDGSNFGAVVPVDAAGVYAVGATVDVAGEAQWSGVGLNTRSYPAEYAPRPVNSDGLERLAALTGGRVDVVAADTFDPAGTLPGTRRYDVAQWLLWFALLAWPLAVASSRWTWRRGLLAVGPQRAVATVRELRDRLPKIDRPQRTTKPSGGESDGKPFVADSIADRLRNERPDSPPPIVTPRESGPDPATPAQQPADATLDQLLAGKRRRKKPE